jgi:hypothetical protein
MAGNVLDLEVEIVMMSIIPGSTSTSCPSLTLIVQLKPHILTQFKCFVSFSSSTFSSQWGNVFKSLPKSYSTVCILKVETASCTWCNMTLQSPYSSSWKVRLSVEMPR